MSAEPSPGPGFHRTAATYREGAMTLPGEYYTAPAIFAREAESIGARRWHCVGRSERIRERGSYFLQSIAGESIIVLRDRTGQLRAHFNVCRHRGTRLCDQASGRFGETIQCAYHAWTYGTDGALLAAPQMQDATDFDRSGYGLHQARIGEWAGFLFVNLDPDAAPLERELAPLVERFDRFGLDRLVSGRTVTYEVRANWKLVFQNYSECLHCPTIHPELTCKIPYQSGANDLVDGPFLGGYMDIAEGNESVTMSGRRAARPIADLPAEDLRRGYYYAVMPNLLLTVLPDYVTGYRVWPESPDRTRIESEWLFHPEAAADPAFNPEDAVQIWDVTNRQDWYITEQSQAGISSRRYAPGPYSPRESLLAAWDRAYLAMLEG